MSGYLTSIKSYIARYQEEVGNIDVIDPHELAAWAYKNGFHQPSVKIIISSIAADIAQVFREEHRTDGQGRRYRAKHAVRVKQGDRTLSLWADIDDPNAPHEHFQRSFAQRRQQIIGDCFQLKTDVEVYNKKYPSERPIQITLDFTQDINQLQHLQKISSHDN